MHFWIGVENFAKIESAKICVDNYTVLVGQNNSGKTFLMQLVQGINVRWAQLIDEALMSILLVDGDEAHKEFVINNENISQLIECINSKLATEKEKIIKEIFGKEIAIDKLYIDISLEEDVSYNLSVIDCSKKDKVKNIDFIAKAMEPFELDNFHEGTIAISFEMRKNSLEKRLKLLHISFANNMLSMFQRSLASIMKSESLFLPASRTGLLLLYRDFFAKRADDQFAYAVDGNKIVNNEESVANLTEPMYEFLRFLQTYSEQENRKATFLDELRFFEEHLIEGRISVDKQGVFSYDSKSRNSKVPMYLASSMINEVAPLVLAITSQRAYNRLIIDEVEASLHPQKQLELVRFLNRLNNRGIQLIISTHSDTFVSKLNNLYILAEATKEYGDEILEKFNLEKEDLIFPERLFVYEFVNQPNGKSVVKEITANKKTGYQFDLFTESAMHLYDEATQLGEMK